MGSGRLADGDVVVEEGALGGLDDALAAAVFASWWERDDGWPWRIKLDNFDENGTGQNLGNS